MTAATPFERLLSADAQLTDALVNKLDEQTLAALLVARFQSLVARGFGVTEALFAAVRTGEPEALGEYRPRAVRSLSRRGSVPGVRLMPHESPERRCIRERGRGHSKCQQSHASGIDRTVRSLDPCMPLHGAACAGSRTFRESAF